jgi:Spy/CpxP family protein refolding chaperone
LSSIRFLGAAALAAVLALPVAALAQQAPPAPPAGAALPGGAPGQPGRQHHGGMRAALTKLGLSDAQRTQIDQAFAQSRAGNQNADPATRRANHEKLRAQIDGILTPAQRTQLMQQMQQMRQRHERNGWASPMPGATPTH